MRILVHGGGLQALSCGESLHHFCDVDVLTDDISCLKSIFFKKKFNHPVADDKYFESIDISIYDVIIPVSDICVGYHSRKKSELESRYRVKIAVPDYSSVSIVEDKNLFMNFCEETGVAHPLTITLSNSNLIEAASKVGLPALIKPNFSVGARGITIVNSIDELKEKYPPIHSQFGDSTLQELIENNDYYYNVMMYRDKNGNILGNAIIKIVRMYPVAAGSSTCCISIENQDLLSICKDALDKLNWVGMADFDVLQRLDTGEYKVIEINPRVPASIRAAFISGINFPEIIVRDTLGLSPVRYKYRPSKILRYLGTDLLWAIKTKKLWGNNPSWWKFISKSTYYQDIFFRDPSTWVTWLWSGLRKLSHRNKKLR